MLRVLNVLSVEMLSVEMLNVMNVEGVECTHGSPSMLSIQTYQYMNNRSREYLYETVNVWKESMRLEWVAAVTLVRGARGGATALPASVLSRGEVVLRKVTCRWTVCVCSIHWPAGWLHQQGWRCK